MNINDIKPGMKVRIIKDPGVGRNGHGMVGHVVTVQGVGSVYVYCKEFGPSHSINCQCLGPVGLTKTDLRTGMRVQYRCGWERVVVGEKLYDESGKRVAELGPYEEALVLGCDKGMDIVKVWAAPSSCEDFFDLGVKGALLFEREEKSEKDLKKEELSAKMDDIKKQLSALQEEYNSL